MAAEMTSFICHHDTAMTWGAPTHRHPRCTTARPQVQRSCTAARSQWSSSRSVAGRTNARRPTRRRRRQIFRRARARVRSTQKDAGARGARRSLPPDRRSDGPRDAHPSLTASPPDRKTARRRRRPPD
jgi:hypothetical protein